MEAKPVIALDHVSKVYPLPSGDVIALDNLTLQIGQGEFVAIMGPSGSGKSTLLNQIGCMDVPTEGDLYLAGQSVRTLSDRELTDLRLNTIGFIFQKFNLISVLTAYENVEYPYLMKHRKADMGGRVQGLLTSMGIDPVLALHRPPQLSGGQQQRVSIARALVNDPAILLCDEPTGNLDTKTGSQIMGMVSDLNRQGRTIVMVTHDPFIARYATRTIFLRDGRIE